jgi:hypothetical protein
VSIHVTSWVFRHSEAKLGARLVLLVLAEHAHDDGGRAFPSVDTIVERTRMSRRGVQEALRRLEADAMVEPYAKTKDGCTVYRVLMGGADSAPAQMTASRGAESDTEGAQLTTSGGAAAAPNPSGTLHTNPSGKKRASAQTEHPEFGEWIGNHHAVTGVPVLGAGSSGRRKIAAMFAARRQDGLSLEDLKAATLGAFEDEYRRERGYFDPESVLRPTKVAKLVANGRRVLAARASAPAETVDWSQFDD